MGTKKRAQPTSDAGEKRRRVGTALFRAHQDWVSISAMLHQYSQADREGISSRAFPRPDFPLHARSILISACIKGFARVQKMRVYNSTRMRLRAMPVRVWSIKDGGEPVSKQSPAV